jgi:acetyltransferase-like isoleucine patch superfamily enzyme
MRQLSSSRSSTRILIGIFRSFGGVIKAKVKLFLVYPFKYNPGTVQSLIPRSLALGHFPVIEENVSFSDSIRQIGDECYIGSGTIIDNCLQIGSFSSISKDVKIGMSNHPLDRDSTSPRFYLKKYGRVLEDTFSREKPCIIEEDVLISANAVVLAGIKLGKGSVVAAGAVVTKNVEPYSIVGGVPATFIRFRLSKAKVESLIESDIGITKDGGIPQ